ncbi:MAG: C-terminal binding protein [Verrucomicrobia bacterium]|nr:C-terminal binding protein [Verrucomicrobiota bacterium]
MKVVVTDYGFKNLDQERTILAAAGAELVLAQCKTTAEVIAAAADADALLVQWAPVNAAVIAALKQCRIIIRYGIGVDNVDLAAAKAKGIPVCNVPDYCIDEVAAHAVALSLALARQLPQIHQRVLGGTWKIVPDKPMPAFKDMTFATAGLGRIARAVLERAKTFGFRLAAHDPYAPAVPGVASLSLDELFRQADILSLHSPLTAETKHLVNATRLKQMKATAIIVNTARGGLIDTAPLAAALRAGTIAGAGLDVFETEPLPSDHPLRQCPTALLTSHVAWYSERSVPTLQRMAAADVVRGLHGEPLKNQVN